MNDSDGDVVCYLGQCELLNQSTCLKLERPKEENLTYDLDGCFSSSQLRDTVEYGDYQQVWYGVLLVVILVLSFGVW